MHDPDQSEPLKADDEQRLPKRKTSAATVQKSASPMFARPAIDNPPETDWDTPAQPMVIHRVETTARVSPEPTGATEPTPQDTPAESTPEEPTTEEPAIEELATEQPATEEPTAKLAPTEAPTEVAEPEDAQPKRIRMRDLGRR